MTKPVGDFEIVSQYEGLFKRDGGWRHTLYVMFGNFSIVRRFLGGKWELWGHDMGTHHAVLSWHWMRDWSDTVLSNCSHVVAKAWYENGRKLNHQTVFLR